jgi:uracil permease
MNNLIYRINEKPNTVKEMLGYSLQVMFSCITATLLIALICGTNLTAGLVAAGISTIFFLCITKFRAPLVISNSGATVSAVIGAIALAGPVEKNFLGVIIGGLTIAIIYSVAALLVKKFGVNWITKVITPVMSGAIILIISIQLGFFIPTYAQINGEYSLLGIGVMFFTMALVLVCAFYGKGLMKRWPILFGVLGGYIVSIILALCGVQNLVDLSHFQNMKIFVVPDFAFMHVSFNTFDWSVVPQILISFSLVALGALAEHLGDVINASNICERDFLTDPGLHRTLIGDGFGSFIGTIIGAQPNTTYTENLSTILISKCASIYITLLAAIELIVLGFFGPFSSFILALPNAVFAGASICCYGMIGASAIKFLKKTSINFDDQKTIWIFAIMLMVGTSGLAINYGSFNITGICLAIVVGIILNLTLKSTTPERGLRAKCNILEDALLNDIEQTDICK